MRAVFRRGRKVAQTVNLIICGFQRSGSTALMRYLDEHPRISFIIDADIESEGGCMGLPLACRWALQSRHGEDGAIYRRIARNVQARAGGSLAYVGIKETYYVAFPYVPYNIREHLPDAKLMFILRNPVEAVYSGFCRSQRKKGAGLESFSEWVSSVCEQDCVPVAATKTDWNELIRGASLSPGRNVGRNLQLVERGFYYQQLMRYVRLFDRRQILALRYDELAQEPERMMQRALAFLGLPQEGSRSRVGRVINAQEEYPPMSRQDRERLHGIFAESNRQVLDLLDWPRDLWG